MLKTEMRNPNTTHFDKMALSDMLKIMNEENMNAVKAVGNCIDDIGAAVEAVSRGFAAGGRLFYVGAGTSGRLGIIDAAECPPTFGVDYDKVIGIIAGGRDAMFRANEGGEDSAEAAVADISRYSLTTNDVVIGISLPRYSTRTVKLMQFARENGAQVIAITDSIDAPAAKNADHVLLAKSEMMSVVDSLVAPMSLVNALIVSIGRRKEQEIARTFENLEKIWQEYEVYERVES